MITKGSVDAIIVAIVLVAVVVFFGFGFSACRTQIVEDCEKLGAFRAGDKVFKCQVEK